MDDPEADRLIDLYWAKKTAKYHQKNSKNSETNHPHDNLDSPSSPRSPCGEAVVLYDPVTDTFPFHDNLINFNLCRGGEDEFGENDEENDEGSESVNITLITLITLK